MAGGCVIGIGGKRLSAHLDRGRTVLVVISEMISDITACAGRCIVGDAGQVAMGITVLLLFTPLSIEQDFPFCM